MYAQVARDGPKEAPTLAPGGLDRGIVTTDRIVHDLKYMWYMSACGVLFLTELRSSCILP